MMGDKSGASASDAATHVPRAIHNRAWYMEKIAIGLMVLGALMMFQPFAKILFTYSFIVILSGVVLFTIFSRMAD